MEYQIWSSRTRNAFFFRAFELLDAGDREGYDHVMKTAPLPPYLAKVIKEKVGLDCLLKLGWNLSEVEAEFGSDWLRQ